MLARNIPEKKRKMNSEEMPETMCESSERETVIVNQTEVTGYC
jgi:hypothetical protein